MCVVHTRHGVVRTNDVAKMERIVRIGNGQPDEAFLPVPPPAVGVARRGVPGRGGDDLIVGNLPVPDTDPVAQGSSCRIDRAKSLSVVRHIGGPDHGRFAAFCPQLGDRLAHELHDQDRSVQTGQLAEPGIGALGPHPGRDEGITGEKEVDHRPELDHLIRVACRFGVAVLSSVCPCSALVTESHGWVGP